MNLLMIKLIINLNQMLIENSQKKNNKNFY